jgi:hypothetical protein
MDEKEAADWVIVSSEDELVSALGLQVLPPSFTILTHDSADKCLQKCQHGAVLRVQRGRPLALLLTPDKRVLRVAFPSTGRVTRRWSVDGGLNFAITGSPAVFTLRKPQLAFMNVLSDAVDHRTHVLVLDPDFDGTPVLIRDWSRATIKTVCDERFDLMLSSTNGLLEKRANELYCELFTKHNCEPPYTEGITFRFCRAFCHTVADALAGKLAERGVEVGKAWAFASPDQVMSITTTSRKNCTQDWWFHVAVVVKSTSSSGGGHWVFDPIVNLEGGVLSLDAWKKRLGPGLGRVHLRAPKGYSLDCVQATCDIEEPCLESAMDEGEQFEELKIARCALSCIAAHDGDPPYKCPK